MLDANDIALLKSLMGKGEGNYDESHKVNDEQSAGIEELARAVESIISANQMLTQKVEELCKKVAMIESHSGAFIDNWERLAKEKSRFDGVAALKEKHGANAEYADIAKTYSEAEGSDIFETIFDLLMEAKDESGSAVDNAEQAEFDEDGFVSNVFGKVGERIKKIRGESPKQEAMIEGEAPAVVAESKEIAIPENAKPEEAAEAVAEEVKPTVAEQIRKAKARKSA